MRCCCCGKPLKAEEQQTGWHKSCIRKFFGTIELPEIDLSAEHLSEMTEQVLNRKDTVAGVQKKLSLHLETGKRARLTLANYPSGYILKPQAPEYAQMPEAEFLVMKMAELCGIKTVPCALLLSKQEEPAYITRRIDRKNVRKEVVKLAMEDFCQLDQRQTEYKYSGSYERCSCLIRQWSSQVGLDQTELFMRLVFCFITGNSDMHLKNFSLIEEVPGSGEYRLAPAYDLLPVRLILPEDAEDTALTLNGKKRNLRRNDFLKFAESAGIQRKSAERMMDRILGMESQFIAMIQESYLSEENKEKMIELLQSGIARIQQK